MIQPSGHFLQVALINMNPSEHEVHTVLFAALQEPLQCLAHLTQLLPAVLRANPFLHYLQTVVSVGSQTEQPDGQDRTQTPVLFRVYPLKQSVQTVELVQDLQPSAHLSHEPALLKVPLRHSAQVVPSTHSSHPDMQLLQMEPSR